MHIIFGATGHVGSSVLSELLSKGEPVLAITHTRSHDKPLRETGAEVAIVDITDKEMLAQILQKGTTAFLLNPPGTFQKILFS